MLKKKYSNSIKSNIVFNIQDNMRTKPANPNKLFTPKYNKLTPFNRKLKEFYNDDYEKYKDLDVGVTLGTLRNEFKE